MQWGSAKLDSRTRSVILSTAQYKTIIMLYIDHFNNIVVNL
jgi:hypothetical protein